MKAFLKASGVALFVILLFIAVAYLVQNYLMPFLPADWQSKIVWFISALAITIGILSGLSQIIGVGLVELLKPNKDTNEFIQKRENTPSEFYVPKQTELKNKINIETLNLQRELKTFLSLSGERKRKQLEVVLDLAMNIWKNLLNPAKVILGDTPIPILIDDIYTQLTRYRGNWELLQGEYDAKNNWLGAVKTSHPEIIVINKRIAELEAESNQLWNNIEAQINQLIELT